MPVDAPPLPTIDTGDTAWVLVSAALVMLMTPGLAFFYGGLVRSKNVLNTMMMSFIALGVVAILWAVCGYSLAFSPGNQWLGGLGWVGLSGVTGAANATYAATLPHLVFMVYQLMFAVITPALVSGAVVDRLRFGPYVAFMALWSLLVYAPLAHWVWGDGGFLRDMKALDFAGGTVVHISAGVSALVAAKLLGPRRGWPGPQLRPHNVPFVMLGAALLWFGWFGFNAGSALGANALAGLAFVTTNLAAAAALVTWCTLDATVSGKPTAVGAATGAVVGLVTITPAAGFVSPMSALAIGAIGATVAYFSLRFLTRRHWADDSLDVFACHGMGGITGALLTGVFASKAQNDAGADGLLHGALAPMWPQLAGVLCAAGLGALGTLAILGGLKATVGLRVADEDEQVGLDVSEHAEEAYTR